MSDKPSNFETADLQGETKQFAGSVTDTPVVSLPAVAGNRIAEALIRCEIDNNNQRRLLVSFDGGTTFLKLAPGEFVGWSVKSPQATPLQQIIVKSDDTNAVLYEALVNLEEF